MTNLIGVFVKDSVAKYIGTCNVTMVTSHCRLTRVLTKLWTTHNKKDMQYMQLLLNVYSSSKYMMYISIYE